MIREPKRNVKFDNSFKRDNLRQPRVNGRLPNDIEYMHWILREYEQSTDDVKSMILRSEQGKQVLDLAHKTVQAYNQGMSNVEINKHLNNIIIGV